MTLNCVTDTITLMILRAGYTDFLTDGSFNAGTETFHADIDSLIEGEALGNQKIVAGVPTLLTGPEQTVADAEMEAKFQFGLFFSLLVPPLEPETITTTPETLSLRRYASILDDNLVVTLPDGTTNGQSKRIQVQGGGPGSEVICTLVGAFTGFDLSGNSKAELVWSGFANAWLIIDSKGLTKNP